MAEEQTQTMQDLFEKLNRCTSVKKFDKKGEPEEAVRLAHGLCDIKEACEVYLNDLFPKLLKAETEDEIADALHGICHELGHIHYHLSDSAYLAPLLGLYKAKE